MRLMGAAIGCALAILLALAAAHFYERPRSSGSSTSKLWLEPDFLCALASGVLALAVGAWIGRAALSAGALGRGSVTTRAAIWLGLTLLLWFAWTDQLFLFTIWIAPTHSFACTRLIGLWSAWRSNLTFRQR
jgi:hypothetical protein